MEAAIHEEFVTRLVEMARGLRLGGLDVEADMGLLISSRQQQSVLSYWRQRGARFFKREWTSDDNARSR